MERNLSDMDLDQLRETYSQEMEQLETLLLSGSSWHDVEQLRSNISQLSIELYNKLYSNPAESSLRSE